MTQRLSKIVLGSVLAVGCGGGGGQEEVAPDAAERSCEAADPAACGSGQYCAPSRHCEPAFALNGLTATVEKFMCSPPGQSLRQCAAYHLAFVAQNHGADASVRLERTKLVVGGTLTVEAPTPCTIMPWQIAPGGMTPVLDLRFDYRGGPTDGNWPAFNVPCGFQGSTPEFGEDLGPAPLTGDVQLTLSVRLASGTLVEATASATLTPF